MMPGAEDRAPVAVGLLGNAAKPDIGLAVAAAATACRAHGLRLLAAQELAAAAPADVTVLP
ncbi:hypothetical protein FJ250_13450, partial [bacterium]|nr:hypothetical protein [bacterium]